MSKIFKTLKWIIFSLLCLIFVFVIVECFYFPKFLMDKEKAEISASQDDEFTVMSYNIRCHTPLDLFKRSWYYRADMVKENIEEIGADIMGFQEVTKGQYNYLVDILPNYDSVINYRDESIISEGCPLFYNTNRFELIDKGSFWLSETPDVMSKSWGSAHYRICSYINLKDKVTNKELLVFNTHLDHKSVEARVNGIKVVLDKIKEFGNKPAILMGDLNAKPNSDTIESILEMFNDSAILANNDLETVTYHGFDNVGAKRLDYIMLTPEKFTVESYYVYDNLKDGLYASDHSPIYAELKLI